MTRLTRVVCDCGATAVAVKRVCVKGRWYKMPLCADCLVVEKQWEVDGIVELKVEPEFVGQPNYTLTCVVCGELFGAHRKDARFCGHLCQRKAYYRRKKYGENWLLYVCDEINQAEFREL